jgi:hypothetical protein
MITLVVFCVIHKTSHEIIIQGCCWQARDTWSDITYIYTADNKTIEQKIVIFLVLHGNCLFKKIIMNYNYTIN